MPEFSEMTGRVEIIDALLDAALPSVAFEGWSESVFRAAVSETGIDPDRAAAACPGRSVDLALAFHRRGDARMLEMLDAADLAGMRFRDRVATAVKFRLQGIAGFREQVRRGAALFAVPLHSHRGARAMWDTADCIWNALGDGSNDINWYSKRAILTGVLGASVLFWIGDNSESSEATWRFIDRRIDDVMKIEKAKARARQSPACAGLVLGIESLGRHVRPPPDRGQYPGWVSNGEVR